MKTWGKRVGILVVVAVCLVAMMVLGHGFPFFLRYPLDESSRLAMFVHVQRQLEHFYARHGTYPSDLEALGVSDFPDGSSERTWKGFVYRSDGRTFRLESNGIFREDLVALGVEGSHRSAMSTDAATRRP